MLSSSATDRKFDAKFTADSIRGARLTALRAKVEVGGAEALTSIQSEHARDCDPLSSLQENIIATLRQGAAAPATQKR